MLANMGQTNIQAPTIIPKALAKGGDLVVIPRKEYERLKARGEEVVPPIIIRQIDPSSLTPEQRKRSRLARRTPISKMLNI